MLTRIWRWVRDFDKWPETQAYVTEAVPIESTDGGVYFCRISFYYRDGSGVVHDGWFTVREKTELYEIHPGQYFPIQYDPRKPSHYHARGVESTRLRLALNWTIFIVVTALIYLCADNPHLGN